MCSEGNKEMEGRKEGTPPCTLEDPYIIIMKFQNHRHQNILKASRKTDKKFKNTKQATNHTNEQI